MSADVVQGNYEQLQQVATRFQKQSEQIAQMEARMRRSMQKLESSWEGRGAQSFAREMSSVTMPGVIRLKTALTQAHTVTAKIANTLKQAEEEAAALFKSQGGGGAAGAMLGGAGGGGLQQGGGGGGSTGPDSSGPFRVGPPTRPNIKHDDGFLGQFKPRDPDIGDRLNLLKWRAKLEAAEAFRPDLADGTAAYRHFLDGNGADRQFDYERYVQNDPSGQAMLNNIIRDAQKNVEVIGQGRTSFSVSSDTYAIGGGDARFPYPDSENWQKAIGGHTAWSSADVTVSGTPPNRTYTMNITVHGEDRYNFNPGQSDIATGIPDSDNGVFEITGLAKQYNQYGQVTRTVTWTEGNIPGATITDQDPSRNRRPGDNRRARNRI